MNEENKYGVLLDKLELPSVVLDEKGNAIVFNNLLNELFRTKFSEGDNFFDSVKKKV